MFGCLLKRYLLWVHRIKSVMSSLDEIGAQFAKGDFSTWVNSFEKAGFVVRQPLIGVLQICVDRNNKSDLATERLRLLISVGVHGDETAPIEIMVLLLEKLSKTPQRLAVDLMVVVGNIDAIAKAKRYIDVDLNRLFSPDRSSQFSSQRFPQFNNAKKTYQEIQRADQLMDLAEQFFHGHQHKWHLDLHTAIRASAYSTFAITPGEFNSVFISWLGDAGIAAVVLNPKPSATFSSYTYTHLGAVSCTAELGRIGKLGQNDLSQFLVTQQAIDALLCFGIVNQEQKNESDPLIFCVAQELIKHSDAFRLTFDDNTPNFTEFSPGTIIATDGEITYTVGTEPEFVLFPNPSVRVGLRAGLMVARWRARLCVLPNR